MTNTQAQPAIAESALRTLCSVLEAENAALSAMDIPAANRLLAEKIAATDGLTAALRPRPQLPDHARAEVARLAALAQTNKALLERAMAAQKRVIGCIARAVPRALGESRPYAANGRNQRPTQMPPISLSSNA